jgi:hypothetical protein
MTTTFPADYLVPGFFTDARDHAPLLDRIARRAGPEPRALAAAVRDLMVHVFWRGAYGLPNDEKRSAEETNLRGLDQKLERVEELAAACGADPAGPLPSEWKLIGNCRDHSLIFAALLRHVGIPARARAGFATYFIPGHHEDHWIVERWDRTRGAWMAGDPQLDDLMLAKLGIRFDPMDLPAGSFLPGGEAWLACRAGADPSTFGIFKMTGMDFVKGDFVLDLLSLAGRELLPWDFWGIMERPHSSLTEAERADLDAVARRVPLGTGLDLAGARTIAADPRFALPRLIKSWTGHAAIEVDLGEGAALG